MKKMIKSLIAAIGVALLMTGSLFAAETVTLSDFVQKVVAGNGVFDGNGATVQITPVSGDARTETKEGLPNRLQKYTNPEVYYAQYQRFGNLTDVSISNVKFVFVPAPVTVVDAWNTAGATTTADNINGELQLLNAGNVTFINCSFEKMSVSPINATAVSVSACSFNGLDAYAIKDIKASTVTVADATFTDCNGGFWMNAAPAVLSVTGNTFANVGRRGAIQFSTNGDYSSAEMTVTGNKVTGGAFLWQLNPTVTYEQVSAILDTTKNTYGTAYVSGSVEPPVAKIGDTPYCTLAAAAAAAQAGDEIVLLADVTLDAELTLPAGIKFNGNGKTVAGTIKAGGNLEFVGNTIVSTFNPGWYNNVITIGAGASLKATSGRMTVSYGNTFNITGTIADGAAKTVDKATVTPSLELVAGVSFNGNGGGVNLNVLNAYVKLGDSTTKNSGATGKFNLNFTNSIVDFTKTLKTYMPTADGLAPEFSLNAKDSVIDLASHLEFWLDDTAVTLDNTKLTVGGSFANAGALELNGNSEFVVKAPIMSSHGGNTGTITVNSGTFELVDSNEDWENAGEMTVGAEGTLKINDFKCVDDGTVSVDATGMNAGDSVADRIVLNSENTDFGYTDIQVAGSCLFVVDADGKLVERTLAGTGTEADPFVIASFADLELFRDMVNGGDTYAGKFVKMTADIDLNNEEWTPIAYMGKTFRGTFDGNGKTISNLKITKELANAAANNGIGFFGRTDDPAVIKNLTIENVDITGSLYVGAIVGNGYTGKAVENCTVKGDITIDAWWYAGVIGGNGYMNTIKDCHVIGNEGSYIKGNSGSYIGGIWGFRGEGANSIVNCSVQNLEVIGVDRVGGIAGIGHYGNKVSTCSVKNVTITAKDPDATTVGLIVGACQGTASEPSVFENNVVAETVARVDNGDGTFKNVAGIYGTNINGSVPVTNFEASINGVPYMTLAEAVAAAQAGDEIVLLADATVEETLAIPADVTIKSNGKTINGSIRMLGNLTLNGPLTITGGLWVGKSGETLTATLSGDKLTASYFMFQHGTYTINADIDAVYGYLSFEATFEVNSTIHTTGTNGEVLYINGNVTLNDGAVLDSDNSVFVYNDNAVLTLKAGSKVDSNVKITTSGAKVNIDATGMTAGEFTNITGTVTNSGNGTIAVVGNDKLEASIVDGKIVLSAKPVAEIDGVKYGSLLEAISALKDGDTLTINAGEISEGTIKFPASLKNVTIKGETGAILKDMTLMACDGSNIAYEGITFDGIVFDNSNILFSGQRASASFKDWTITNCEFKNVARGNAAVSFNLNTSEAMENFTFTNNVIDGVTGGNYSGLVLRASKGNVVISGNDIKNVVWNAVQLINSTADTISIEDNRFASGADEGILNLYGVTATALTIRENQFLVSENQPGICYIESADVSLNYWGGEAPANLPGGVTFSSYYTTAEDGVLGGLVELPDGTLAGTGTEADPFVIASLADFELFRDMVNGGNTFDNQFVKLTADIDLNSVVWTPIGNGTTKFLGTFDGSGKTISNLVVDINANNAGLFGFASVIKNLAINNAKVEGVVCVGAMVGELESSVGTLDNCHVTGRIEVTGENSVGGLAGKGYANIRNSSVIGDGVATSFVLGIYGTTEEGDNVGGLIGHLGEGNTLGVANSTVKNIKVVGTRKIGGLVGTTARANDYVGNTVENVTVESSATAEYANDNASTCTIGGIIGNYFGSATSGGVLKDSTVKDVTFVIGNAKSAGALVGGDRVNNGGEPVGVEASGSVVQNVAGATVSYFLVAQIGDSYYATLQAALDAAAAGTGNVTVEILSDIDLTGTAWNPVTVSASGYPFVTVNGNDKTITGLNDMLFAGTWAGKSGLVINDLTIAESTIVNDENDSEGTVGVGAFIGYPQASETITLKNCHLTKSTVKGGHWTGGLIGMAGGYSGNDGPVFMTLTIEGCSVTDSTITGKGSAGGIIGHGSCSAWTDVIIVNSTVSGNTITSTGSSNNKAGSVMGTIGAAGQPTTADGVTKTGGMSVSVTTADNTVKSADKVITTIYGRQGTPTGLLEIAGGTYEAYPIEENVNYAAPKEGYIIFENADGKYGVKEGTYVAQIDGVKYETLASALAAAQDGATVELLWAEGNAPIAMNGSVYGKSVTITGTATVDWSKGFLFVGRGGEGNGTVIFDNANLASASNNASTGIHVSGREKNTNNKYDGTVVINNSTIVLDYLIDKGAMTMTNSTLTVKNGFAVGGRPASETESGVDATATFDLTNGSTLIVNNHNGMGLGYEAIGVMTIDSTSTFECTLSFLVTGKGALNVAKGGQVELTGTEKKLTVNGTLTSAGNVFANIVAGENADIEISGGVYTQDVEEWCAEGYQSVKQPGEELWQVGKLPNAEVVNMGPTEITEYQIFNGSGLVAGPETPINLQVALEFIAKDTPAQAAENAYGQYITDFYITIDGAAEGSFTADGCYLAGNYGTFGWIMIPLDGMVIENGVVHPVITSAFAGNFEFTYENICSSVKDFKCGIYFSPEVLAANPGLSVSLDLGLSETIEKAQDAEFTSAVEKPFVYDVQDMTSAVAISGPDYFTTVTGAVEVAVQTGDFVKLVTDANLDDNLAVESDLVLNLGGNTLTANGKTLAIANSVVTITNGTLSAFTKDNIALTGNAVLTVTGKDVADSFRTEANYYVSQNANGTHSIMLKSAFRVFITMVDGEPRIGFFKDCSGSAPTYTLLGATNLENPEWQAVNYEDASDASDASTLPLYWAKLDQAADDTKVYRFFKIGPAPAAE